MQKEMRVILGAGSVRAYVASPKAFQVIGIVRFGLKYGLLATDAAGNYFRVNGSQVLGLHAQTVRSAISVAHAAGIHNFNKYKAAAKEPSAVSITIRKHRHYDLQATQQHAMATRVRQLRT